MGSANQRFTGIITALITPFAEGKIDWTSFEKLLDFQLEQDIDGFVVNGTTGESPTLNSQEVKELVVKTREKIQSSGRSRTLIVGTGSNNTAKTIEATKLAEEWGADAALVVTPYYNKPPQRGLVRHFQAIADSVKMPILLYNVPGRTITAIAVESVKELSETSNIVGIKEASGDMKTGEEILKVVPENFVVTSGDDGTCMELARRGGQGTISVCSHIIGKQMRDILKKIKAKDDSGFKEYESYQKFISQLYTEANPIPLKMALHLMGVIKSPELRLPMIELDQKFVSGLRASMMEIGLIHG